MVSPTLHFVFVAITTFAVAGCTTRAAEQPTTRPVVVVELFTSEGCSSCPPADAVLKTLSQPDAVPGIDLAPLGLHVDYWNQLGWADPFSSAQFSNRQQEYARSTRAGDIYTPQMIVQGGEGFVGSDRAKALAAVSQAAKQPHGTLSLQVDTFHKDDKSLGCKLSVENLPKHTASSILLAISEDGLTSDVRRGENAGRQLQHAAVVRSLREVATLKSDESATMIQTPITITILPAWNVQHLHVTAFVQEQQSRRIIAAAQTRILNAGE